MINRNLLLICIVLIVGASSQYDLTILARVPLSELLAFASLPYLYWGLRTDHIRKHWLPIFILLAVWLIGVTISDVVNGVSFERYVRGAMKPIFCGLWGAFFMAVILRNYKAVLFYPLGECFAAVQNLIAPQAWTAERIEAGGYQEVAYGYSPVVMSLLLFFGVILYKKNPWWTVLSFLCASSALMLLGSPRSMIAVSLMNAFLIVFIIWNNKKPRLRGTVSWKSIIVIGAFTLLSLSLIYFAYVYAASVGWLGEMQLAKIEGQSNNTFGKSPIGLVLGGRTAVFGAILAIVDRPLIGYGSWSGWMLTEYFYEAIAYVGTDSKLMDALNQSGLPPSPGHSILFTAWMESGVIVAMVLCVLWGIVLRQLIYTVMFDNRYAPLIISIATLLMWHFFFSPFGTGTRWTIGFFMALHVTRFCTGRAQSLPPSDTREAFRH